MENLGKIEMCDVVKDGLLSLLINFNIITKEESETCTLVECLEKLEEVFSKYTPYVERQVFGADNLPIKEGEKVQLNCVYIDDNMTPNLVVGNINNFDSSLGFTCDLINEDTNELWAMNVKCGSLVHEKPQPCCNCVYLVKSPIENDYGACLYYHEEDEFGNCFYEQKWEYDISCCSFKPKDVVDK